MSIYLSVSEGMEGGWVDGLANSVRRCSFLDVVLNSVNMPGLLGWYFVFVVCGFPSRCLVFWTVNSLLWICKACSVGDLGVWTDV